MTGPESDLRNHAGPYGFTRREIAVLASVLVTCIAVIAYAEWRDRQQETTAWVIEDVLVDVPVSSSASDTAATLRPDTSVGRPTQDHSDLIDINTADLRTLARLPGIGPELARRIMDERSTNGAFINLTDLQRVKGIGPRKAAMLSGWVKFSDEPKVTEDSIESP